MAINYHVIVTLSDKVTIEYDECAVNKFAAFRTIIRRFSNGKIKAIKTA